MKCLSVSRLSLKIVPDLFAATLLGFPGFQADDKERQYLFPEAEFKTAMDSFFFFQNMLVVILPFNSLRFIPGK